MVFCVQWYVSCTVLNTLHGYFIYFSQQLCEVHTVFIPILNLWKVKHREVDFSFKVMEILLGSWLQNGVTKWSTSQPSFYRSTCRYHSILFHGCIIVYWMELTKWIAPPTKNGQVPLPTESRKSYQSVLMVSICMDQSVW